MKRSIVATSIAILLLSRQAAASPPYPALVAQEWSLKSTPDCTLCHATEAGGTGTVVTYFGKQLQSFGLRAEDESSLAQALARDKAEGTDSDGDGVADFDALTAGISPNAGPGPTHATAPAPEYGCAMSPGEGAYDPIFFLTVAVFVFLRARRRSA